jgi:tripartite-type tricarboxylate transporter receptor subunit TctC
MKRALIAWFVFAGALALAGLAGAQGWPTKPPRIIVSNAAASAVDIAARLLADHLSRELGQQFIIDNRVGAEGVIGAEAAARSAPDGYTYYFGTNVTLVANTFLQKSLPYDAARDFAPVGMIVDSAPFLIVVHPSVPARTLPELIKYAKEQPNKLSYATTSPLANITGDWLSRAAGIDIQQVWYKVVPQSIQDTVAGTTQMAINAQPLVESLVKAGKLRTIAITSRKRFPPLADVPTVFETIPGFVIEGWFMLVAPTGTAAPIVQRLNREINVFVKKPDVVQKMYGFGFTVPSEPLTIQAMNEYMREQREFWASVVKTVGFKPE